MYCAYFVFVRTRYMCFFSIVPVFLRCWALDVRLDYTAAAAAPGTPVPGTWYMTTHGRRVDVIRYVHTCSTGREGGREGGREERR